MAHRLAWPVRREGSSHAVVLSGSDAALLQDVQVLMSTRPGERAVVPGFGAPDLVGSLEVDAEAVTGAISRWLPRVASARLRVVARGPEPDLVVEVA